METVKTSRWYALFHGSITNFIHPPKFNIQDAMIHSLRIRTFILPWMKLEENMHYRHVASVQQLKGLIWDAVCVETTGGSNDLVIGGLRKREAKEIVELINGKI